MKLLENIVTTEHNELMFGSPRDNKDLSLFVVGTLLCFKADMYGDNSLI